MRRIVELTAALAAGVILTAVGYSLSRDSLLAKHIDESGLSLPHPEGQVMVVMTYDGEPVPSDRATAMLLASQGFKLLGKEGKTAHIVLTKGGAIVPPGPCNFSMEATTTRRGGLVTGEHSLTLTTNGTPTTVFSMNTSGTLNPEEADPGDLERTVSYSSSAGWSPQARSVEVSTGFYSAAETTDVAGIAAQSNNGVLAQVGHRQERDLTPVPEAVAEPDPEQEEPRAPRDYLKALRWIPGLRKKPEQEPDYDNNPIPKPEPETKPEPASEAETESLFEEQGLDLRLPELQAPLTQLELLADSFGNQDGIADEAETKSQKKRYDWWRRNFSYVACVNGEVWSAFKKLKATKKYLKDIETTKPKYAICVGKQGGIAFVNQHSDGKQEVLLPDDVSVDYRTRTVTRH